MVNPDWDLRGYLSHSGKPPGGTLHTGRPDRCSFYLILILLQAWRGTLALNHRQRVRADGWRNGADCRQLVLDEAPFVCLSLILGQDMAVIPTLFFSSDYLWANMYNFPTFWIQPSLWTSLSFFMLPNRAWLKNEELGHESDKATLGFRARGGIFGIRRGYGSSPESFGRGNVFLNPISQDTLDINL